jgi:FkbM family methyltransferase
LKFFSQFFRAQPDVQAQQSDFGMDATLSGLKRRGYSPAVVYDIGAADGSWTRHAMRYWPEAHYICFEPLAERQHDLAALRAEYPSRISVEACGVGDLDTTLPMGVTDFLWDSSFAYSGSVSRDVSVRRLDSMVDNDIPAASFIKIDTQGYELKVLDGGKKAIQQADFILMECTFFKFCEDMRTLDATIAYMSERNFIPYEFVDYLRRPLDGAMGQCDILFVRRGHELVSQARWA